MKALFVWVMLSFSLPAVAADAQQDVEPCSGNNEITGTIMKARQSGVTKPKLYQLIDGVTEDKNLRSSYRGVIDAAYQKPIYPSGAQKQKAVDDFVYVMFMFCASGRLPAL